MEFRPVTHNGMVLVYLCLIFLISETIERTLMGNYYFSSTQLKSITKPQTQAASPYMALQLA